MIKAIALGDCWFCEGYNEFEEYENGLYRCKICKTEGMNPTHINFVDTEEMDHV